MLQPPLLIVGAYLLGAIPFGLLIGKAHGIDIRTQGSRNIGATNAGRVLGRKWGYLCLLLDVLKGFVPALTASLVLGTGEELAGPNRQLLILLVGLAAVLGHVFPIYLGFRGGKGVATTVGVALGVYPYYTVAMSVALIAYALLRFGTGRVSPGSLALAIVFPAALYVYLRSANLPWTNYWPLQTVALALAVLIIARHADNIRRLWRGKELDVTSNRPVGPGAR